MRLSITEASLSFTACPRGFTAESQWHGSVTKLCPNQTRGVHRTDGMKTHHQFQCAKNYSTVKVSNRGEWREREKGEDLGGSGNGEQKSLAMLLLALLKPFPKSFRHDCPSRCFSDEVTKPCKARDHKQSTTSQLIYIICSFKLNQHHVSPRDDWVALHKVRPSGAGFLLSFDI